MIKNKPHYSVIVPVYNEEGNAGPLFDEIHALMIDIDREFEIIFVDDASTDGTIKELEDKSPLTLIRLRNNSGQSSALDAGLKAAQGEIIITMDGDGQDDPGNIPHLLRKLSEGYDVVCAWRYKRKDSPAKRFLSWGWRHLRSILVDDGVHDAGTQLRVYKAEALEDLDLYGELHRFIPAILKWRGFKVGEIKVNHRPRLHGATKYNWKRPLKGFSDMIYIWFWRKYSSRPLHLFGSLGLISFFVGSAMILVLAYLRLFHEYYLSSKIWPLVGFFFILAGIQFFTTGLLAANNAEVSNKKKYYIKEIITH